MGTTRLNSVTCGLMIIGAIVGALSGCSKAVEQVEREQALIDPDHERPDPGCPQDPVDPPVEPPLDDTPFHEKICGKIYDLSKYKRLFAHSNDVILPAGRDWRNLPVIGQAVLEQYDLADRTWLQPFPGSPKREWYAYLANGSFKALETAHYSFILTADDGAYFTMHCGHGRDSQLVEIDLDGVHSVMTRESESIFLEKGQVCHYRMEYFQGPRLRIALELRQRLNFGDPMIVPGGQLKAECSH